MRGWGRSSFEGIASTTLTEEAVALGVAQGEVLEGLGYRNGWLGASGPGLLLQARVARSHAQEGDAVRLRLEDDGELLHTSLARFGNVNGELVFDLPLVDEADGVVTATGFLPYAALPRGVDEGLRCGAQLLRDGVPTAHGAWYVPLPDLDERETGNLLAALVDACVLVAQTSGSVVRAEVEWIGASLAALLDLDLFGVIALKGQLRRARATHLTVPEVAASLRLYVDVEAHPALFALLRGVGEADGGLDDAEALVIAEIGARMARTGRRAH